MACSPVVPHFTGTEIQMKPRAAQETQAHQIPATFISNFFLGESFYQRATEPYYALTQRWLAHSHSERSARETSIKGFFI